MPKIVRSTLNVHPKCFKLNELKIVFVYFSSVSTPSALPRTLHIISHYKGYHVSGLCKHLTKFLGMHIRWVAKIEKIVLEKKKLAVEEYVNSLAEGTIPLDQLGLLCVARNWHIHICVFLKSER